MHHETRHAGIFPRFFVCEKQQRQIRNMRCKCQARLPHIITSGGEILADVSTIPKRRIRFNLPFFLCPNEGKRSAEFADREQQICTEKFCFLFSRVIPVCRGIHTNNHKAFQEVCPGRPVHSGRLLDRAEMLSHRHWLPVGWFAAAVPCHAGPV